MSTLSLFVTFSVCYILSVGSKAFVPMLLLAMRQRYVLLYLLCEGVKS